MEAATLDNEKVEESVCSFLLRNVLNPDFSL